jgi:hypothetical protein
MFEVNKVHLNIIRIINEYRNNRISVDFVPKDGSEKDSLAGTCDALYRADEQDSAADEAYDNAFEEAVGGGFGAWRVRACYENELDPEDDRQRVRFEPIFDADSCVFFDPTARRQDKADAKYCFVLVPQDKEDYIAEWGDDPTSWEKPIDASMFDWATPDTVYIAEYYVVEEQSDTLVTYRLITGEEQSHTLDDLEDDDGALLRELASTGSDEIKRRKIKTRRVHKYLMSGGKVLEDCGVIAGKHIPIIPVFGKRWVIDGVERMQGHVRTAKDSQRLKNMQISRLGEISALSPVQKPIFTPEQVSGHQVMWADDNVNNYPYLLINPVMDASGQSVISGPVGSTQPPQVPPALGALLQLTEQDLKDLLGGAQNGDNLVSNISGKAVELIQTRLDMQSFIYMSNMAKAVRRCGEVWLSIAQEIYSPGDDERRMKGFDASGKAFPVTIGRKVLDKTGKVVLENDLSTANMDVSVEVGPTSQSRRDATVKSLTALLPVVTDPETQQILQAMVLMNIEGEGITDVREYFRQKLVKLGALKPTEADLEAMQAALNAQQPDPQAEYLKAAAAEAQAKAIKAQTDAVKTVAETELTRAKTAETLSQLDIKTGEAAVRMARVLEEAVQTTATRPADEPDALGNMGYPPALNGE